MHRHNDASKKRFSLSISDLIERICYQFLQSSGEIINRLAHRFPYKKSRIRLRTNVVVHLIQYIGTMPESLTLATSFKFFMCKTMI